jgi:hypothetical protein
MSDQLPATVQSGVLTTPADTYIVPALIADAGDDAGWRYVEFFTANIRNPHTRRAYARACGRFFAWCEDRGLTITVIRSHDVATWVEELQEKHGAPGVKQQLAAVRMLFDWLITGQVVPTNPAAAVRGPKYVVTTGKTSVLDGTEWRKLLAAIPTETVRDLRDRALIGTLTYSFARVGAALKLKVEDLRPNGTGWQIHLARERRQGTQDALPSRVIGNAARLCCRRGHRRRSQGLAVPHQSGAQRDGADRTADESIRGMVHGPPARGCRQHRCADRQPHLPCDGHHEFSGERRHTRTCAGHGRAREPAHDQAL